ncbi:DUF881 domain-containing protein [Nocardioides nitrophenolicus]|uniref:DUF881 domain-containing protein n=1 Tax=Nocardioides nitrophenolicus TaxID=60489 RepID=UPI001957E8A3|nr:DUF881 domain-containing protein [Nocardioides nitrophenolicus]MBM7520343.1 uncharacterized protein YlxW (UPF0749 family) [Nocardioides nitrophenolicus]
MPEQDAEPGAVAPGPEQGPVDRLKVALLRPSRRQLVAAALLALLGFGAVTQVRTAGTDDTYAGLREQELIDLLNGLAGTRQRTETEIDRLDEVASGLRDDSSKRQTAIDQAEAEVDDLNILAGLVPVTGPGLRVTIEEEDGRVRLGSLLDTIQELRTVGAESIEINGTVRVVAQTSFAESDGGFLVDGERIEAPYVIVAIGEPGALANAMTFALGPKKQLEEDGAVVAVQQLRTVDIESVVRREQPSFAVPD